MIRDAVPATESQYQQHVSPPRNGRPIHLSMVGWMVAGIRTHYQNVLPVAQAAPDLTLARVEIFPWNAGGGIERLAFLSPRMRGTLRTYLSTAPLYYQPIPDVVWTQSMTPLVPYLATRAALRHVPVIFDADTTPRLLASFGEHYAEQVTGPPIKRRLVDVLFGSGARGCAYVACWSQWAARSFVNDYGVRSERIRILPPGVDVVAWQRPAGERKANQPVRLLFVGGDFVRKGGDLLLDVWRRHFRASCDLHMVTRTKIEPEPGLFIYGDLLPNDPRLLGLYHTSDVLVLPTRSDCFSLVAIEAMAANLPMITSPVGGIPEIVEDGVTGNFVRPNDGQALRMAIEAMAGDPARRERMGTAGRSVAQERFNARKNAGQLLDLLRAVAQRPSSR